MTTTTDTPTVVATPKKRGRKSGQLLPGSQTAALCQMQLNGVVYFEFDIEHRTAQSYATQLQAVIHREVARICPGRVYKCALFTCVPMSKAGAPVRYTIRVERTA